MKLLIIPSWYPTKIHPESGTFFKSRAQIIKESGIHIIIASPILHSFTDILHYKNISKKICFSDDDIPTFIKEKINYFPKLERLQFAAYKNNATILFNYIINKIGKPDIIMFNSSIWAATALFNQCKKLNIPYIISEHLKEFLSHNSFSKFQKYLLNNCYDSSLAIIATSSTLKKSIVKSFPDYQAKIHLIPNPIDEDLFIIKNRTKQPQIKIVCIALLRKEKRLDILIKAFKKIIHKKYPAKLTLIGSGPLESKLKKLTKSLNLENFIEFTGFLTKNHLIHELHKHDFLTLSSEVETFGMAIIEAQSCGLPVVATECGGPSDLITKKTGILVKPNSVKNLEIGLIKMINNLELYNPDLIREQTIKTFGKKKYRDSILQLISP